MKVCLLSLLLITFGFGLDSLVLPKTFSDSAIIEASDFNANGDTTEQYSRRLSDSIDTKWIRFYDLESGDSTLSRLQVDSIMQYTYMDSLMLGYLVLDSLIGYPFIDSLLTGYIATDLIRSNPDVDSISGNPYIDSAVIGIVDINGGVIDGATVGAISASSGAFTTIGATGNTTIGGTLGVTGVITASDNITQATGKYIATSEVRAVDSNGLKLYDDGGTLGIFIEDASANIGINNITPTSMVDIQLQSNNTTGLSVRNVANVNTIELTVDGNGRGQILLADNGGTVFTRFQGSGISYINGGNLSIGSTTDNGYKLEVIGTTNITGNTTIGGTLGVAGNILADTLKINTIVIDSNHFQFMVEIETTDSVTTNIFSIVQSINSVYYFDVTLTAIQTDSSFSYLSLSSKKIASYASIGASHALSDSITVYEKQINFTAHYYLQFFRNGSTCYIRVKGEPAKDIKWRAKIDLIKNIR